MFLLFTLPWYRQPEENPSKRANNMIIEAKSQSFVVTAYKDPDNLYRLVNRLHADFNVFIHIDKSSTALGEDDVRRLEELPGVHAVSVYDITWGSYKHLLALIDLACEACEWTADGGYLHLISGQDYPVYGNQYIKDFFTGNTKIYMDYRDLPHMENHQKKFFQYKNHLWRFNYWNKAVHAVRNVDNWVQRTFGLLNDNIGGIYDIAQGLVWMSMPKEPMRYVLDYTQNNPKFMHDVYRLQVPEEFVFQTILGASRFKDDIDPNNLRYSDWHRRNGSLPAYLDESDYEKVLESGCLFARKIDSKISGNLIRRFEAD